MTAEEWRDVPGFPGYQASSYGRVRTLKRVRQPRLLSTVVDAGYERVYLSIGYRTYTKARVHRLVAAAFYGPCPPDMECRHLDGDGLNNQVENLRWGTRSENQRDNVRHGIHHKSRLEACPRGHSYSEENTRRYNGRRHCRACDRERLSLRRALASEAVAS